MSAERKGQPQELGSHQLEHEFDIPSSIVLRGSASLRQLRDRVQAVVKELDRLRERNQKLAKQIANLESAPTRTSKTANLTFEEDREQLLKKVNSFIKTIDNYLSIDEERVD